MVLHNKVTNSHAPKYHIIIPEHPLKLKIVKCFEIHLTARNPIIVLTIIFNIK